MPFASDHNHASKTARAGSVRRIVGAEPPSVFYACLSPLVRAGRAPSSHLFATSAGAVIVRIVVVMARLLVTPTPLWYFFGVKRSAASSEATVARTIRFSAALRGRIAADAERCGRSFEGQVIAILRRHYGEDVDIAPSPAEILALATASLADVSAADARLIGRRLKTTDR